MLLYAQGIEKLPTITSLRAEYEPMLEEKKKDYRDYRQIRSEMKELVTARASVDKLFNATERTEREHERADSTL